MTSRAQVLWVKCLSSSFASGSWLFHLFWCLQHVNQSSLTQFGFILVSPSAIRARHSDTVSPHGGVSSVQLVDRYLEQINKHNHQGLKIECCYFDHTHALLSSVVRANLMTKEEAMGLEVDSTAFLSLSRCENLLFRRPIQINYSTNLVPLHSKRTPHALLSCLKERLQLHMPLLCKSFKQLELSYSPRQT